MADKKRRPLHFALSGALLVPGLAAGCGPEEEGPMINVPANDPPEVEETANPVAEDPPGMEMVPPDPPPPPPPTTNLTDMRGAAGDGLGEVRANPVGDSTDGIEGSE